MHAQYNTFSSNAMSYLEHKDELSSDRIVPLEYNKSPAISGVQSQFLFIKVIAEITLVAVYAEVFIEP